MSSFITITLFIYCLIKNKPTYRTVNYILTILLLAVIYFLRQNNNKKILYPILILLFVYIILMISNTNINTDITNTDINIENKNIEEGFKSGDKLKELIKKGNLTEKFKGKLQKYNGKKIKREKFTGDKDGIYRTEHMKGDLMGYYESFNNTPLKNRSGSLYESLTKLYVLKDKLFEIF